VLNLLGIAVLRLSMPYHDIRMPRRYSGRLCCLHQIGRTLHAVRQGVVDVRCCLDWLEQQGTVSSESRYKFSARATPSLLPHMIRAFGWRRSIMHQRTWPTSSGAGSQQAHPEGAGS